MGSIVRGRIVREKKRTETHKEWGFFVQVPLFLSYSIDHLNGSYSLKVTCPALHHLLCSIFEQVSNQMCEVARVFPGGGILLSFVALRPLPS
jgi:hypothetical protein